MISDAWILVSFTNGLKFCLRSINQCFTGILVRCKVLSSMASLECVMHETIAGLQLTCITSQLESSRLQCLLYNDEYRLQYSSSSSSKRRYHAVVLWLTVERCERSDMSAICRVSRCITNVILVIESCLTIVVLVVIQVMRHWSRSWPWPWHLTTVAAACRDIWRTRKNNANIKVLLRKNKVVS